MADGKKENHVDEWWNIVVNDSLNWDKGKNPIQELHSKKPNSEMPEVDKVVMWQCFVIIILMNLSEDELLDLFKYLYVWNIFSMALHEIVYGIKLKYT